MIRNTLWAAATGLALVLTLAYPTSANQGVPYGRTPGGVATKSKPSPARSTPAGSTPAGSTPATPTPAPATPAVSSRSPQG